MNTYEGYSLDCEGGYCDCPYCCADEPYGTHEDDGPYAASVTVSFSSPAVIFENAYTNRPGVVIQRQSTRTTLTCTAHGGEKGITASFSIFGDGKLVRVSGGTLPVVQFVPPQQKLEFEIKYEGCLPSESEKDIVATATLTGEDVQPTTVADELTSVKLELRAVYEAPENPNPTRHLYGVGELVELRHWPSGVNVTWSIGSDDVNSELENVDGCDKLLKLHFVANDTLLFSSYAGITYQPSVSLAEPQGVQCSRCSWNGTCVAKGLAGGVGMDLWLYIIPKAF